MTWIGRILGAVFGFALLSPLGLGILGAVVGFFLGGLFDRGLKQHGSVNAQTQKIFFDATFAIMGFIAKSSGRVSERQIALARMAMQRLGLQGDAMIQAMQEFKLGTQPDFDWQSTLNILRQKCRYPRLMQMFIELQVQTAYADGTPSSEVKNLLQQIAQKLGLNTINFSHIEAMLYGNWRQYTSGSTGGRQQSHQRPYSSPRSSLNEAYSVLGVDAKASDADVKRAYRRKMSENHPDKLMAKGLPKAMIDLATEKTQQIQAAYEQIKSARGMR